jgi:hypothetical protein
MLAVLFSWEKVMRIQIREGNKIIAVLYWGRQSIRKYNHHHDKLGRFASSDGSGGRSSSFRKKALFLDKKEYGQVIHEINNAYHIRFSGLDRGVLRTFNEATGRYAKYYFEIREFGDYNIYHKEED